ncbi:MAG: transcription termination factor NusA [Thermoguttaceae bacterium]|nr:transcription termination factor NusA [Thermoguttaceae bacterium]MDW8036879.1 transcription termination factor NusA [Thermoguttaceae bacterium]
MNPSELLRIVDAIHRDKNIDKEVVFAGIEAALVTAAKKHYGEDQEIVIRINREDGTITGTHNGIEMTPEEMAERIGAQTAKQIIIQKIREAERDALYAEYSELMYQLVTGVVHRMELVPHNDKKVKIWTIALSNTEAFLPEWELIPGQPLHMNERIRAIVCDVKKKGTKVYIELSRARVQFVERLFEHEIPEIADGVIQIRAIARDPGYRTKVAVSSTDPRVDPVGACVGIRGNRIKNIVEELGGERIDIVPYSDDMQKMVPNALQPAEVEEVILCPMLGRAIALVREEQLSLAIGKRGQNVRLASKLCGWDIEIMTQQELDRRIEKAIADFTSLEGISEELAERLIGEGFLTYDDLSVIEPSALMAMGNLSEAQVAQIIQQAEQKVEETEKLAASEKERAKQAEQSRTKAQKQEATDKSA